MSFFADFLVAQFDYLQFLVAVSFFFLAALSFSYYRELEENAASAWKWFGLFATSVFVCRLASVFIAPFLDPGITLWPKLLMLVLSNIFLALFINSSPVNSQAKIRLFPSLILLILFSLALALFWSLAWGYMFAYLFIFVPLGLLAGRNLYRQNLRLAGVLAGILGFFLPFPTGQTLLGVTLLIAGFIISGVLCLALWTHLESAGSGPDNNKIDRLTTALLFLIVIFLLIFGSVLTNVTGRYAYNDAINDYTLHLQELSLDLRHQEEKINSLTATIYGSPYILPALLEPTSKNLQNANSVLDRYRRSMNVSVCYLMNRSGTVIASSNRNETASLIGQNYSFRPYFTAAMAGQQGQLIAKGVTTGIKGYYSSYPVFDDQQVIRGVVVAKNDLYDLGFGGEQKLFLLIGGRELFLASPKTAALLGPDFPFSQQEANFSRAGKRYAVIYRDIEPAGTRLGLIAPLDQEVYYRRFSIAISFLLIFVTGLGIHFNRRQRFINTLLEKGASSLQESQERLAITLKSIGDGLIAAGLDGKVTLINAAAEELTGWKSFEAAGEPLEKVFNIINEETRRPQANPAQEALATGQTVMLANHTVLVSKKGVERAIADSAAPIFDNKGRISGVVLVFRDVTEKARLEKQLNDKVQELENLHKALLNINEDLITSQEKLETLAAIVSSSDDAIIGKDLNGKIISWNQGAEKIYGYSAAEAIGQDIRRLVPSENKGEVDKFLARVTRGEAVQHLETKRITKSGKSIDVSLTISPIKDLAGKITGASTIARDITERRQAEEKIRQLSIGVEQSPSSVVIADLNGNIEYVNQKFVQITGYSAAEVLGKNPRILKGGETSAEEYQRLWQTITGGREWRGQFHNKKKNGEFFWEQASISPIKEVNGRISHFIAIKEDITQKKESERKLALLNDTVKLLLGKEELQAVYDLIQERSVAVTGSEFGFLGIRTPDNFMNIVSMSRPAWDKCKMTHQEMIFKQLDNLFGQVLLKGQSVLTNDPLNHPASKGKLPPGHPMVNSFLGVPIREKDQIIGNICVANKPGGYDQEALSLLETMAESIAGALARIKTENEVKQKNLELEESNRVKSDFTSMVSHELRTPLTSIKEGIGIVLDGSAGPVSPDQQEFLSLAKRNVDRLHRLINDVLDFSKLEAGKMAFNIKAGDLIATVREVVATQETVAKEKGLKLVLEAGKDLPAIPFDPDRISQVVNNFISNAIKFTDQGEISVTIARDPYNNGLKVCVKDTGPGIAAADIPKLFEKFQQLGGPSDRKTGGTGLGLTISKQIVEQHGGSVWVTSEPGKGSSFCFTLPPAK